MGYFYSVRGWLESNDENYTLLQSFIKANEQGNVYNDSWSFPPGGGYSRFAFFGHTVRDVSLSVIRKQIRAIAETIYSLDGEHIDYVEGIFHVDDEDGQHRFIWQLENGIFTEESIEARPRL